MPQTFGSALILLGVIWAIQGFGIAKTGSFMDHQALWGWLGLAAIALGSLLLLLRKRDT